MGEKVGIKKAAEITGLSCIELRTGANSGKYPSYRVGGPRGRIVFDLELLEDHIKKLMLENISSDEDSGSQYGIRKVQ